MLGMATGVGAIIHYALVQYVERDQGVMNYGPPTPVRVQNNVSISIIGPIGVRTRQE